MLPFLAVPLAAAYRKAPLATFALAVVSAATMMTATVTLPVLSLASSTSTWWKRLESGWFSTHGVTVVLFAAFALLAVAAAARGRAKLRPFSLSRMRPSSLDIELTVLALGSWIAIKRAVPPLLAHYSVSGRTVGLGALLALVIAVTAVAAYVANGKRLALLAGLPLVALGIRRFDNTTLIFCLVAVSIGLLVVFARSRWLPPGRSA
jgi:hypothetical protein